MSEEVPIILMAEGGPFKVDILICQEEEADQSLVMATREIITINLEVHHKAESICIIDKILTLMTIRLIIIYSKCLFKLRRVSS